MSGPVETITTPSATEATSDAPCANGNGHAPNEPEYTFGDDLEYTADELGITTPRGRPGPTVIVTVVDSGRRLPRPLSPDELAVFEDEYDWDNLPLPVFPPGPTLNMVFVPGGPLSLPPFPAELLEDENNQ